MNKCCTVCNHPSRAEIDRGLMAGVSYRGLAAQHGLSPSALSRHTHHLKRQLAFQEHQPARPSSKPSWTSCPPAWTASTTPPPTPAPSMSSSAASGSPSASTYKKPSRRDSASPYMTSLDPAMFRNSPPPE